MWGGWYADTLLMDELMSMNEIYRSDLTPSAPPLSSEVVFFADETSYKNLLSRSPHLSGITISRTSMGNTGAPFDTFMVEDAERIVKNYKAAIFPFPIPSEAGILAMKTCEKNGIPYLSATDTHHSLTYGEIRHFLSECGVHLYTDSPDVIYSGGGYLGLHSSSGGKKTVKLPKKLTVTPIFGANIEAQETDIIHFELGDCGTALFRVSDKESE